MINCWIFCLWFYFLRVFLTIKFKWIVNCKMLYLFLLIFVPTITKCQIINRAPHFVPGSGDMARFSLSENTPVGSPVYQLKGK